MRFLFDCEDEIALPAAYNLVDEIKPFVTKIAAEDAENGEEKADNKTRLSRAIKNALVRHPGETGRLLAKLWVLEEGEKAPNAFKTVSTLFSNEVAVDFFTSVMPSLLMLSKQVSPLVK